MKQHTHIPSFGEPNWQAILATAIEPVDTEIIKVMQNERLRVRSAYFDAQISGSLPDVWLRSVLVDRLQIALSLLPEHLGLLVLDGWRPFEVQTALRESIGQAMREDNPTLSAAEHERLLNQFVAQPRTQLDSPSPHLTGGSVDLTLFDVRTGEVLDMGTAFDSPAPESWTAAFENIAGFDSVKENRRHLYFAMIGAGFTNLPTEWWHFDFGNQLWAHYANMPHAIFTATKIYK